MTTPPSFPLTVPEAGRADAVLAAALDGVTRSSAQRWLEEGRITLDGVPVKKNARLQPGQELLISPPQPQELDAVPQDIPLDVVYEDEDVKKFFPKRKRNTHKGTFGTATLICGSEQYIGSAVLAVSAALKSGCGYVKAVCPDAVKAAIAPNWPQTVFTSDCDLSSAAIAVGMGCGASRSLYDGIAWLLKEYRGKLIIDADGLNSLAEYGVDILREKACEVVVTPHVKEFSRLTKKPVKDILSNPVACAKDFAREYNVTVLLKGAGTIICDKDNMAINVRGCSALSKAGSGDMLAGFMCGSAARGLTVFESAVCAAYILGASAELSAGRLTEYCVTSADILADIPVAIKNITV